MIGEAAYLTGVSESRRDWKTEERSFGMIEGVTVRTCALIKRTDVMFVITLLTCIRARDSVDKISRRTSTKHDQSRTVIAMTLTINWWRDSFCLFVLL